MGMPGVRLVGVLGLSRAVEGRLWPISWAFLPPSLVSWDAARTAVLSCEAGLLRARSGCRRCR